MKLLDDARLYRDIGDFGEVSQVETILDGKYVCPDNTNQSVKILLRHLQRPNTVSNKEPPTLMSLAAYRESWRVVKENTSSRGPHIGIYKSEAQHPLLGWIFHQKSKTSYLLGYSLRRHRIGTDVMLPKRAGYWDVKDLRIIVLLDAEANHTNKHIRRE